MSAGTLGTFQGLSWRLASPIPAPYSLGWWVLLFKPFWQRGIPPNGARLQEFAKNHLVGDRDHVTRKP